MTKYIVYYEKFPHNNCKKWYKIDFKQLLKIIM